MPNFFEYMVLDKWRHFFRVALLEFKLSLSSEFVYRWQVLMWVVSDTTQPILLAFLWSAVANSGNRSFTQQDITSYYFLVAIITRFTQDWSIQFVSNSIIAGDFSKYLIRPFNYLSEMFGISLAIRCLRIILLMPFLGIGYLLFRDSLHFTGDLLLFFLALVMGFVINFLLGNIVALSAFFVKQVIGVRALYVNVVSILSGEYIPLGILTAGAFYFVNLLPFRFVLSFPAEILTESTDDGSVQMGFVLAAFWIVILVMVYKALFKFAIRKYEAEGI